MTKLNDSQLRKLKPTGKTQKVSDGLGLTFVLKPNGSRYWHFNYRWYGKQRTISFGTYPETTLKSARTQRTEAREFLAQKADPSAERKNTRLAAQEEETSKVKPVTWRTPRSSATCLRVSPLVSAMRTASLRNSSVRVRPIVHLLCCIICYQRSGTKP